MARLVVAIVFLSLYLIFVGLCSTACSLLSLYVLYNLITETSPGNGAKYRYWLQLAMKDILACVFEHLINLITVIADSWVLSEPFCYIAGYWHVTLVVLGLSFLCSLQFYQYLAIVVTPLEHPKYLHNILLWAISWSVPVVIVAILPISTATDIQFSYERFSCTFNKAGLKGHDTALLVLIASAIGFTCVFCASLSLKVHRALKAENELEGDAKHISLFGDSLVKERKTANAVQVTADDHRADFQLTCILTLANILVLLPYCMLLFAASANSGSIAREWQEFCILTLRLIPIVNFVALMQNLVYRTRVEKTVEGLDYACRCFQLRQAVFRGGATSSRVAPHSS